MKKKQMKKDKECQMNCCHSSRSTCGGVYGLGVIGAAIYYISNASGFWMGVLGILKALFWPAFLVYNAFKFFGI